MVLDNACTYRRIRKITRLVLPCDYFCDRLFVYAVFAFILSFF